MIMTCLAVAVIILGLLLMLWANSGPTKRKSRFHHGLPVSTIWLDSTWVAEVVDVVTALGECLSGTLQE